MSNTTQLKFENLYTLSTWGLRKSRAHPEIPKNLKWLVEFSCMLGVNVYCVGLLLYSIWFHDIKADNLVMAFRNMTMVILAFIINSMYFVLVFYQKPIKEIIHAIDEDYSTIQQWNDEEKYILFSYIEKSKRVCKLWFVSAIVTSSLFPLKSIVLMIYYYAIGEFRPVSMFEVSYPSYLDEHKNDLGLFLFLYLMHILFAIYAAALIMGFEPLAPIFVLHASALLKVASVRMMKLFDERQVMAQIIQLKQIVQLSQHIDRLIDNINYSFMYIYEIIMKFTPIAISIVSILVIETLKEGEINLEFISFLGGCFLNCFIPCYYSDHLIEMANEFRVSLYSCGWEKRGETQPRRMLLNMLTRSSRPPAIHTMFSSLCLDAFSEVCRQAYTLFNLLNAVW
uniref:Odorant receptor n=1 Tax=Conopomorpha sinensis TaxID=940481 RepID=A0A3S7SGR7_9NEOP|nr:putative odorant receptor 5 [Conopomorpha sinensis]